MPKTNLEFNFSVTINLRSFKIKSIHFLDFIPCHNKRLLHSRKYPESGENIHVMKYRGLQIRVLYQNNQCVFSNFFKLWLRKNSFRKLILKNIQKMEFFIFQRVILSIHRLIWTFGSELLGLAKHKQRYYGAYRSFSLKWPHFL